MTKKHYQMIAETIRERLALAPSLEQELLPLVMSLTVKFEKDNPRFDREVFKNACGYADYTWEVNLMSRKPYLEKKGTPICCSPAHETYWSM